MPREVREAQKEEAALQDGVESATSHVQSIFTTHSELVVAVVIVVVDE